MGSSKSTQNFRDGENSSMTKTKEDEERAKEMVKAVAVAAGIGVAAWGVSKILAVSESSSGRKMMKAPGRNYSIFRDEFEHDPASYFRGLRK